MNDSIKKRARGTRWCTIGSWLVGLGIVLVLIGLAGARIDALSPLVAFMFFGIGFLLIIVGGLITMIGIIISMGTAGDASAARAWASLAAGLVLLGIALSQRPDTSGSAPIHDISTDTDNPPAFVDILALRADAPNPAEYAGPDTAAQQRDAYPELTTLVIAQPYEAVFSAAEQAAAQMGWELIAADSNAGRIEATATTSWFRFKDDVVIRILPGENGVRVDVRSKSRVGQGDMGANAARIRAFLNQLSALTT